MIRFDDLNIFDKCYRIHITQTKKRIIMRAKLSAAVCLTLGLLFNSASLFSEQAKDLYSMSLEELLSTKVSVASVKETSLRESPALSP